MKRIRLGSTCFDGQLMALFYCRVTDTSSTEDACSQWSLGFHPEILEPSASFGIETLQRCQQEGERRWKSTSSTALTGVGAGLLAGARSDREAEGAGGWKHVFVVDLQLCCKPRLPQKLTP